jgi:hypothetical protein
MYLLLLLVFFSFFIFKTDYSLIGKETTSYSSFFSYTIIKFKMLKVSLMRILTFFELFSVYHTSVFFCLFLKKIDTTKRSSKTNF